MHAILRLKCTKLSLQLSLSEENWRVVLSLLNFLGKETNLGGVVKLLLPGTWLFEYFSCYLVKSLETSSTLLESLYEYIGHHFN